MTFPELLMFWQNQFHCGHLPQNSSATTEPGQHPILNHGKKSVIPCQQTHHFIQFIFVWSADIDPLMIAVPSQHN